MCYDCSAAVPAAVRRASPPAAPRARRPRDSRQDAGATVTDRTIRALLHLAFLYRARWSLGADVAHAVLDVDRRHDCGIRPPEFLDESVVGEPGERLFEFVSHQQFGSVDGAVFGNQMLVG